MAGRHSRHSGTEDRVIEYVGHLREHFLDPVAIRAGHHTAPTAPGFSAALRPEALARFPGGGYWAAASDRRKGQSS
ncbi:hypothetical protein GCM10010360_56500 [Streptomyces nogalater]